MPAFLGGDSGSRAKPKSRSAARKPSRSLPSWPVLRRRLIFAGLILVALLAAYMLWFRTSSFVAVEEVRITGAEQAPEVDAALRAAADGQSTLHVDLGSLQAAVADDPLVEGITVDTELPHTMLIDVDVRTPVAYLGAEEAVVAADGVILDRTSDRPEGVPGIEIEGDKSGLVSGDAVSGDALEVARVIGAAPGPLAAEINEGRLSADYGVTVDFGPGHRAPLRRRRRRRAQVEGRCRRARRPEVHRSRLSRPQRPRSSGRGRDSGLAGGAGRGGRSGRP